MSTVSTSCQFSFDLVMVLCLRNEDLPFDFLKNKDDHVFIHLEVADSVEGLLSEKKCFCKMFSTALL